MTDSSSHRPLTYYCFRRMALLLQHFHPFDALAADCDAHFSLEMEEQIMWLEENSAFDIAFVWHYLRYIRTAGFTVC